MPAYDISSSPLISKSLAAARDKPLKASPPKLVEVSTLPPLTAPQQFEDKLSIHGVPEAQMTPEVREALSSLMNEVKILRTERVKLMDALRKSESLADTDPLAETYNRRAFMREMARIMSFADRYDIPSSLLFFDLDGFKAINDTHGHQAGDLVIKAVAKTLSEHVRESDLVGRVGGDEFAVLLAKANDEEANFKGQQLSDAINNLSIPFENSSVSIKATFGVHAFVTGDTAEIAMAKADEAMYYKKLSSKIASL